MNCFKLLFIVTICVAANGLPLETPTEDFSKFFESSRIVGGVDAPEYYVSYQAALVFGPENHPWHFCGATIISESYILTAAHCIDPVVSHGELIQAFHGRVGSNSYFQGGEIVRFNSYINHPLWDPFNIKYDVGILGLSELLKFSSRVAAIALNYDQVEAGEEGFVTGWGLTSLTGGASRKLQLLYVTKISSKACAKEIKKVTQGNAFINPHAEICTFHSVGHGMCRGDSGSALVSKKDKKQIGIVSWGFACALGLPDVFTSIPGMKTFIQSTLKRDTQYF